MTLNARESQISDILNRIKKRYKHLNKWAKGQAIDYFRIFDRDIQDAPFMIDSLPKHWLVWVCDHSLSKDLESEYIQKIMRLLNEFQPKKGVVKYRKKNQSLSQSYHQTDDIIKITENGLSFELNLTRYLDVGLFIDHRNTRQYIRQVSKGKRVLNLFSYTGSFSCYALAGGANFVTAVDLNTQYGKWHQINCDINHINPKQYQIITEDVRLFLKRHKSKYDIIICDPPSFSQSNRKGVERFQIQDDASELLSLCQRCLKDSGFILFSTNYKRFKIDQVLSSTEWQWKEQTNRFCTKDFEGKWGSRCWEIQPVDSLDT